MGYVLLVVAILIAGFVALAGWAKPTDAAEHEAIGAESSGRGELDVYELAYPAEGPHRVVNTAIVVLMNRELIRISRGGRIHRVSGSARASADAVEQAVLVSASRPGGVTAAHLRRDVKSNAAMAELDLARLAHLAACAEALEAPLVSEHLAFVREGDLEAGHLLPVPRTREALSVIAENVRLAQAALPVPLALENVAARFGWPGDELTEAEFLGELVERTGVKLLVDVANLYTNQVNLGLDARDALDGLPLGELAYVHVAGGHLHGGVWHDTHTAAAPEAVLDILAELCGRVGPPGVLLEWDDDYPSDRAMAAELDRIRAAMSRGGAARG
jgi:uncharacterized protein (UPF0276 family)